MKKLASAILAVAVIFSLTIPSYAVDTTTQTGDATVVVMNEYEELKKLAEQTPATLGSKGLSSNEIATIKNYQEVYRNHIEDLQTLSDNALSKNGYNEAQINMIRNFAGTEEEMVLLSAELTFYSSTTAFRYVQGGRTTGGLAYNWEWNGIPVIKMQDMVAATWNSWRVTDDTSYVTYFELISGEQYSRRSAEFTYDEDENELAGAGHRFEMTLSDNYYYAKMGGGTFSLESDGFLKKDFSYYIAYGHATVEPEIGFSVSLPGGAAGSISWNSVVETAGSDRGSYVW